MRLFRRDGTRIFVTNPERLPEVSPPLIFQRSTLNERSLAVRRWPAPLLDRVSVRAARNSCSLLGHSALFYARVSVLALRLVKCPLSLRRLSFPLNQARLINIETLVPTEWVGTRQKTAVVIVCYEVQGVPESQFRPTMCDLKEQVRVILFKGGPRFREPVKVTNFWVDHSDFDGGRSSGLPKRDSRPSGYSAGHFIQQGF